MSWSNVILPGQMSIFELLASEEPKSVMAEVPEIKESSGFSFEEMLKKKLISYGTGFVLGRYRVHKILHREDLTEKEKISSIKAEFGLGGTSQRAGLYEVHSLDTFHSVLRVRYETEEGEQDVKLSWKQVYDYIKKWDDAKEYYDASFEPKDFTVSKHYFCNGALYLKISDASAIYEKSSMKGKNLYIVFQKKDFSLVSVLDGKCEKFELTSDEEYVIERIGFDYGWSDGRNGIWGMHP